MLMSADSELTRCAAARLIALTGESGACAAGPLPGEPLVPQPASTVTSTVPVASAAPIAGMPRRPPDRDEHEIIQKCYHLLLPAIPDDAMTRALAGLRC
jgi:hypothetical protein